MTDDRRVRRRKWQTRIHPLLIVALAAWLAGCAATIPPQTLGRLPELRRGTSTKADVERLLGERAGVGQASFPEGTGAAADRYEIWYYRDQQRKPARGGGDVYVILPRMLLVFFEGDRFDGYLWFDLTGADVEVRR